MQHSLSQLPPELVKLQQTSRRAAAISLVGGIVVLGALGGSAWQVANLQGQRADLERRVGDLRQQEGQLKVRVAGLQTAVIAEQDRRERALAQIAQGNGSVAEQILATPVQSATPAGRLAADAERRRVSVPRVYFQIRSRDQGARYQACAKVLVPAGYRVPQYELVSSGPGANEVRYFHEADREKAVALAQQTQACIGSPVRLVYVGRYSNVNPMHFEVWLAP